MKPKTRSILEELNAIHNEHENCHVTESRGIHIIQSAINLIEHIHNTYDNEIAEELERRLINSIRGKDSKKFQRAVRKAGKT